ncbi:MAG: hypothetical protein HOV81_13330 [Kofleriaceae bacterium]|nr:hypothetical protein [Kofleriaceae bacterium]
MKRHAIVVLVMMCALLALFAIVQAAGIDVLIDPRPAFAGLGALAAVAAVGLLIADVLLPVPSSLVMVWLGASQGWLAGAALSLVGCVGATVFAFWLGRRGGPLFERLVPRDERARADAFLARWGVLAIAVTRPVPIIAETTAVVAGASPAVRWRGMLIAAIAGCAPWAVIYGLSGAALV